MQEPSAEFIGPEVKTVKIINGEKVVKRTRRPYQDLKDALHTEGIVRKKYDQIVVFGEGPPKQVIFSDEATAEQLTEWQEFQKDPLRAQQEPKFRITDISHHNIPNESEEANPETRKRIREERRRALQNHFNYAKKRWGEMNAGAAGYLLYIGATDKLILTGGKTGGPDKPSEAELMRDKIIRKYGDLFFRDKFGDENAVRILFEADQEAQKSGITFDDYRKQKYEQFVIEELYPKFIMEERATNTITNTIFISKLLERDVAFLTSGHHLDYAILLNTILGGKDVDRISAQKILQLVGQTREKYGLVNIASKFQIDSSTPITELNIQDLRDIQPDLALKITDQQRWLSWINDDDRLSFWLSQALSSGDIIRDNDFLTRIFSYLKSTPAREQKARDYFALAGLDYNKYANKIAAGLNNEDLDKLSNAMTPLSNWQKYRQFSISELQEQQKSKTK